MVKKNLFIDMNPYKKQILKKVFPININRGKLHESFHISTKPEEKVNDIYYVLRPDKDEIAASFFPGKTVVYLRYDKEKEKEIILKYLDLKK